MTFYRNGETGVIPHFTVYCSSSASQSVHSLRLRNRVGPGTSQGCRSRPTESILDGKDFKFFNLYQTLMFLGRNETRVIVGVFSSKGSDWQESLLSIFWNLLKRMAGCYYDMMTGERTRLWGDLSLRVGDHLVSKTKQITWDFSMYLGKFSKLRSRYFWRH